MPDSPSSAARHRERREGEGRAMWTRGGGGVSKRLVNERGAGAGGQGEDTARNENRRAVSRVQDPPSKTPHPLLPLPPQARRTVGRARRGAGRMWGGQRGRGRGGNRELRRGSVPTDSAERMCVRGWWLGRGGTREKTQKQDVTRQRKNDGNLAVEFVVEADVEVALVGLGRPDSNSPRHLLVLQHAWVWVCARVRACVCMCRQTDARADIHKARHAGKRHDKNTHTHAHSRTPHHPTPHTYTRTEFIVHVDDSLAPVRGALPWGGTQPDLLVSLCETDVEPQHERMAVVVAQGLHVHTHQHPSSQCLYRAESTRRCSSAPILKIS